MSQEHEKNLTKAPSGRVKRKSVGTRSRLHVQNKDPNYVYRFVNDMDDNVDVRLEQGYEIVKLSDHRSTRQRVESGGTPDNMLSVGGGTKAVLMRIPKEYWDEDQKAKAEAIDRTEQAIKKPSIDGAYGKIETSFS